ncbi:hypothetical protein ON010_g8861 [Phytophthora cinnamomi]|nr:hypothetical protein ON010_g8861 [Phytophthora cinnamomi]
MMLWGGVLFAPVGHAWYNFLERAVRGKGAAAVAKKIAADQLVFSPPLSLAFFTYAGCSEGKPLRDTVDTAVAKTAADAGGELDGVAAGARVHLRLRAATIPNSVHQRGERRLVGLPVANGE